MFRMRNNHYRLRVYCTLTLLLVTSLLADAANYLCFTAEADNSEVWYVNEANNHPDMQYSTDGGASWTVWEANDHVPLPAIGSKVYIRGNNPNGLSHAESKYTISDLPELDCTYFKMKGRIAASGSVMSLIDGEGNTTVIPSNRVGCFFFLFGRCNVLTKAPELPATTLAERCYGSMFYDCGLTEIPELPATTLAEACYSNMFMSCSKLEKKPVLPATTLATNCYLGMFSYTGLTEAPDLPATKLEYRCYAYMFREAKKLVKAPELQATELTSFCYEGMFESCTSLTTAPELPAQTLVNSCYYGMFKNCTSLNYIKVGLRSLDNDVNATKNWVSGINQEGVFIFPCGSKYNKHGESEVPDNFTISPSPIVVFQMPNGDLLWRDTIGCDVMPTYQGPNLGERFIGWNPEPTVLPDPDVYYYTAVFEEEEIPEPGDWLCFTAEEDGATLAYESVGHVPNMRFSRDGITWNIMDEGGIHYLNAGEKMYVKGKNPDGISQGISSYTRFVTTKRIAVSGNVMSLIDEVGATTTIPSEYCFYALFRQCSITQAPTLPSVSLTDYCYADMFSRCENLTTTPDLPATEMAYACYDGMFSYCTNLTSIPDTLPSVNLSERCYARMFLNCRSITKAPVLPAKKMEGLCYISMFYGCINLTTAPELPALILDARCYTSMFEGCMRLERAPELPATELHEGCYANMFNGCSSLNYIKVGVMSLDNDFLATSLWVEGVNGPGTFVFPCGSKYNKYGESEVPPLFEIISSPIVVFQNQDHSVIFQDTVCNVVPVCPIIPDCGDGMVFMGWDPEPTLVDEPGEVYYYTAVCKKEGGDTIPNNWLCFTAEVDESFVWYENYEDNNPDVRYSIDGGITWQTLDSMQKIPLEKKGDKVYVKGYNPEGFSHGDAYTKFNASGIVSASGSVMSLIDSVGATNVIPGRKCFSHLFAGNKRLVKAPELPATTLSEGCYWYMFSECTMLTEAPELPATQLEVACYGEMFTGCDNLTRAPELPATEMKAGCYGAMFTACRKLTQAPKLPATQLAEKCYLGMFNLCSQLLEAPELPATQMENGCYMNMFSGCVYLTKAPELPATQLADSCYQNMFRQCIKLSQAPELPATQLAESCYMSMFLGCDALTQAPELPATSLADHCYEKMFGKCIGLTQAPELPATQLANYCYKGMFENCENITRAPELKATSLVKGCYSSMFSHCGNLNYIKVGVMTLDNDFAATENWVAEIDGPGVFIFPCGSTYDKHGSSEVPTVFEIRGRAYAIDSTITAEGGFSWKDTTYTESASWSETLHTVYGCDSIINYHLEINGTTPIPAIVVDKDTSACDLFVFKDITYTESASWNDTLKASSGGDSIIVYHLTIHKGVAVDSVITAEGSFTWNGNTYTEDTTWSETLQTVYGCDSIINYHLEINGTTPIPAIVVDKDTSACDLFVFKDITYTESASWNDTLKASSGGDSIIVYHLTIHKGVAVDSVITAEGSFTWKDTTYTESASWNETLQTAFGCDSVIVYHLEIKDSILVQPIVVDKDISACDEFVFKDVTYMENTSWNDTLTTASGADSIITYHLTIHKSTLLDTTITAMESVTWQGVTYTESISWIDTLQTVAGCDSIVRVNLVVKSFVTPPITVDKVIFACDSFVFKNSTYRESSSWNEVLKTADGGDSIVSYRLTIHKGVSVDTTITAEGSFTWKGTTYTEDASWSDTLQTVNGCDSIVRYKLVVNEEKSPLQLTVEDDLYLVLPGGSETISYELTGGEGSTYEVRYKDKTLCKGDVTNDSTVSLTCPKELEPGAYTATLTMYDGEGEKAEKEFTFNVMLPDNKQKSYYVKVWNDVVICRNGEGQFLTYQWYKGREKCEEGAQQFYNDKTLLNGEYMVYVSDKNGKSYFIEPFIYAPVEAAYTITAEPNVVARGTDFTVKVSGVAEEELPNARVVVYRTNGVVEKLIDEVELESTMRLKTGEYVIVLTVHDGKNANCKVLVK